MGEEGSVPSVDLDELTQTYLTDSLLALHLLATREVAAPDSLVTELGHFAAEITAIEERDCSRGLADMTELLARALAAVNTPLAGTVSRAAESLRERARDQPFDVSPLSGWSRLHRGAITGEFYEEVEAWLGDLPEPIAYDREPSPESGEST